MDYKETDFSFLYDDLTEEYGNEQGKQLYICMCEKYSCPELCTLFCQSDITVFSGYEPKIKFERNGTLEGGANCCDFHFIHGIY